MHQPSGQLHAHGREWPWWAPIASAAIAGSAIAVAAVQRMVFRPADKLALVWAAVAISPYAVQAATAFSPRLRSLDPPLWRWLSPIPVIAGTVLLVWTPVPSDFVPFILVFLTAEVVSSDGPGPRGWLVLGTSIAVMVGAELAGRYDGGFIWVLGLAFGWFGGFLVNAIARTAMELQQAQAGLSEQAATEERRRIASEVHDVIAHSLTVTMLNVTAARMAAERGDASDAAEALREAERHGRQSLADIRRTVGLLGSGEATAPPAPTVTSITELVEDFRRAGVGVTYAVTGDVRSVPPAAGLALYRIAQESLGNAAKHAPGCDVALTLDVDGEAACLVVRNAVNGRSPATGGGHGVEAMAARARTLGGALVAERAPDGWTVRATIPITA